MKNIVKLIVLFFCSVLFGQQIRYIDTEVILNKMPSYQQANQRLNTQVAQWKTDLDAKQRELDNTKKKFESERVLLTDEQIKTKQQEITDLEVALKKEIEDRFGADGDMLRLRQSIVKPVQDQIMTAIAKIAQKNKIDMIFDKNSDFAMIYSNPKFDYTEQILKELKLDDKSLKETNSSSTTKPDTTRQSPSQSTKPQASDAVQTTLPAKELRNEPKKDK